MTGPTDRCIHFIPKGKCPLCFNPSKQGEEIATPVSPPVQPPPNIMPPKAAQTDKHSEEILEAANDYAKSNQTVSFFLSKVKELTEDLREARLSLRNAKKEKREKQKILLNKIKQEKKIKKEIAL